MTSYIAHYTKKKQILARKKSALQRFIDGYADVRRLIEAAEDVRDARVRVVRARRATIVPKGDAEVQYQRLDERIQAIEETPADAILAEFGYSVSQ